MDTLVPMTWEGVHEYSQPLIKKDYTNNCGTRGRCYLESGPSPSLRSSNPISLSSHTILNQTHHTTPLRFPNPNFPLSPIPSIPNPNPNYPTTFLMKFPTQTTTTTSSIQSPSIP
ncbi:hypothetical protein RIF29_21086 [Crotalaria pallida]|uniref:Uncharacterized protein n=1 Tax=Crotalaria pallida TaxID=3830 RepID=A0AAN9I5M5_CROPI